MLMLMLKTLDDIDVLGLNNVDNVAGLMMLLANMVLLIFFLLLLLLVVVEVFFCYG